MPNQDATGPMGQGLMTGKGRGSCEGSSPSSSTGFGRGRQGGGGQGRHGRRRMFRATGMPGFGRGCNRDFVSAGSAADNLTGAEGIEALKERLERINEAGRAVQDQIASLEAASEKG